MLLQLELLMPPMHFLLMLLPTAHVTSQGCAARLHWQETICAAPFAAQALAPTPRMLRQVAAARPFSEIEHRLSWTLLACGVSSCPAMAQGSPHKVNSCSALPQAAHMENLSWENLLHNSVVERNGGPLARQDSTSEPAQPPRAEGARDTSASSTRRARPDQCHSHYRAAAGRISWRSGQA